MKNVEVPSKVDNGLPIKKLAPSSSDTVGPLPPSPKSRTTTTRNKITCNSSASTSSFQNKTSDYRTDVDTNNARSLDFDNNNHDTNNTGNDFLRRYVVDGAGAVPIEIMKNRFNHGFCPQCGLQIYHVNLPPKSSSMSKTVSKRWLPKLFGQCGKENHGTPATAQKDFKGITKNGLVIDGRCLLCYPIQQHCENEGQDPEVSNMIQQLLKHTSGDTTQSYEVEKYQESWLMGTTPKNMEHESHPDNNNNALSTVGTSSRQFPKKKENSTTQVESPTDSQKNKNTCVTTESNNDVARVPGNFETNQYQESNAKITNLLESASNSGSTKVSPTSKRKLTFSSTTISPKDKKKPKHRAGDIQNTIIHDLAGNEFGGAVTEGTAEKGRGVFASYFVSANNSNNDNGNDDDLNGRCKSVSIYEGYFENGLFHGYGIYRDIQGHVYEGEFECSKRHGFGKFKTTHGGIYTGTWCDNKFLG